jgi:hypothetical protein
LPTRSAASRTSAANPPMDDCMRDALDTADAVLQAL